MSIRWSDVGALAHISQLKRFPPIPVFWSVILLLASTQLRTLSVMDLSIVLSYLFRTAVTARVVAEAIFQYILGFGTWYGLSTIGEPPLTQSQPCGKGESCLPNPVQLQNQGGEGKLSQDPMPAWLIFLFFALVSARYILSTLVAYIFQVISAVVMVSSEDVTALGAARADRHPAAKFYPENRRLIKRLTKTGSFRPEFLHKGKRSLTRSLTMPIESLGRRFFGMTCLRGLNAYLIMSVAQWYLGAIADFFLSGQPKEVMPGYGSSSVMLAIFFGGGSALWTHYAITEPSNRNVYHLFPQGKEILVELFPITCLWAVCEQVTMSLPLAMSRSEFFELRQYAWNPSSWNELDAHAQRTLLGKFALVYLVYLILVGAVSIPSTMMLRRIHASMLPEAGEAIVPYTRGNPQPRLDTINDKNNNNNRSKNNNNPTDADDEENNDEEAKAEANNNTTTHRPGLTVSQAWATLTWPAYFRVLRISILYFLINQLLHLACWEADWRLHAFFQTERYASPFPSGAARVHLRIFG